MGDSGQNVNGGVVPVFSNLPLWSKAITVIGIPGVIALYLVWMGSQILPNLEREMTLNRAAVEKNQELLRELLMIQRDTNRLWLAHCISTAADQVQRDRCFEQVPRSLQP